MLQNLVYDPASHGLRFDLEGMIFCLTTQATTVGGSRLVGFYQGQIWRSPNQATEQWGFRYDIDKRLILDPLLPEKHDDDQWDAYRMTLSNIISILYDAGQIVEKKLNDSTVTP